MPRVLAESQRRPAPVAGPPPRAPRSGLVELAAGIGNAAFARLARQAVPAAQRTNLAFIMGADRPDRRGRTPNHFFRLAREYAAHWNATIVDAPRYRTLAGIFDYLRVHPELRVGDLYIVTHANADGDLLFPFDAHDSDRRVTFPELAAALTGRAATFRLGGQIDAGTTIRIKGCNLGAAREMVELVDQAFGGAERVIAPTHPQEYSRVHGEVVEHYGDMRIERAGDVHLTRAELVAEFRDRYTQIPERWWERIAALPDDAVLGRHGVFRRSVRRIRIPGSVAHGRGQTGRPDAYEWSAHGRGRRASATGVMTEYRLRHDRTFQVAAEDAEDQRFFTTSFSGPPGRAN
jgi:hypothetical protein